MVKVGDIVQLNTTPVDCKPENWEHIIGSYAKVERVLGDGAIDVRTPDDYVLFYPVGTFDVVEPFTWDDLRQIIDTMPKEVLAKPVLNINGGPFVAYQLRMDDENYFLEFAPKFD